MGLIECPDCKAEVSDSAKSCPKCGCVNLVPEPPLPKKKSFEERVRDGEIFVNPGPGDWEKLPKKIDDPEPKPDRSGLACFTLLVLGTLAFILWSYYLDL